MLSLRDDVRDYSPAIALACVFVTFILNASSKSVQVVGITVNCALIFLLLTTVLLIRKEQTFFIQFHAVAACTFALFGFALGSEYVKLHVQTGGNVATCITIIVLLCVSSVSYIILWGEQIRELCSRCNLQSSSELFETASNGN